MAEQKQSVPQVRLGYDNMEAYLELPVPTGEENYTLKDLQDALLQKGVVYGVDEKKLQAIVQLRMFNREIQVAQGISATEGTDGYYEYHFRQELSQKPKLRPDGSVDYWSIDKVEPVRAGQVIAVYHPAVQGENGVDIKGKPLNAKRSRELGPLKGKGFSRSEDNLTYTALTDGKIEMQNDRILIMPVYEIVGNADMSVGYIDFRGDVIIHGNVCTGVIIKASGTITIDGIVEAAELSAGKDIVVRGGMMGGSKASVFTKGNISAKFFEYTRVEAWGDIQADVLLNCEVISRKRILLDGKKASIVGGKTSAIEGIEVINLGNDSEVRTEVMVGNETEVFRRIKVLQKKIIVAREMLNKIEKGLRDLEKLQSDKVKKDDPRKAQLLRVKIRDTALLSADEAELQRLEEQVEAAKDAGVRVLGSVFPGVVVKIDDLHISVWDRQEHVEYIKNMDKIVMYEVMA